MASKVSQLMHVKKWLATSLLSMFLFISVFSFPLLAQNDTNQEKFTGLKLIAINDNDFVYEYKIQRGQTVSGEIQVVHDFESKDKPAKFYALASDFAIDSESGGPVYPDKDFFLNGKYSLAKHISFDKEEATLNKYGDNTNIKFTVNLPPDAAAGSYYAALLFSNITAEQYKKGEIELQQEFATGIGSRLAPVVIVTVEGDLKPNVGIDLEVLNTDMERPLFGIHEYLPVNIRTTVSNSGNLVINPAGNIFIHKGDETKPIKKFKFNEEARRVLPDSSRPYFNVWDESLILYKKKPSFPTGGYITLRPDKSGTLKMGKYYATAAVTYKEADGTQKVATLTEGFWVIPWKLILALILIIVITIYALYKRSQRKQKGGRRS